MYDSNVLVHGGPVNPNTAAASGPERMGGGNGGVKICICRVDERLIHGQVTAVWCRQQGVSSIFVIDDELAKDRLTIRILRMTAPPKTEVRVLSAAQMAAVLSGEERSESTRAMLLFRTLAAADELFAQTGPLCPALCLGGMPSRIGRHEVGKNLFLSKEERGLVADIAERYGVSVISQILPSDPPVDVGALIQEANYPRG